MTVQGLPLMRPPWGRITAIDLNRGEIVWQVAHGDTPDWVKEHPALQGVDIPRTGRKGPIGTLTTKTLLISGEGGRQEADGGFVTTPDGRRGALLRAYDKATGADAGTVYMPAPQTGTPMTYLLDGRQYVVVAVGGPQGAGRAAGVCAAGGRVGPGPRVSSPPRPVRARRRRCAPAPRAT